jgi:malate synthase
MTERVRAGGLQAARSLYDFINDEALPGTGVSPEQFWSGLDRIVHDLAPVNRALLAKRDELQARIDVGTASAATRPQDLEAYKGFCARSAISCPKARISAFRPAM